METNETLEECVKRELKEELNLDLVQNHGIVYESSYQLHGENHAYTVFLIEVANWEEFKLEEGKADEFRWIDNNQIEILNIDREDGNVSPVYNAVKKYFGTV